MKKLFVSITALLFASGIVFAQNAPTQTTEPAKIKTAQTHAEKCTVKNCVMMENGKMVVMKNGKTMPMTEDVTLANGTKIMKDGTMILKDGKKSQMKNDDCIAMTGAWDKTPAKKNAEKK